jgi:dTDP-4-amino-4,6-dideoxygalactose transaminase
MKVPFVDLYLQYLSIKDEIDHAIEQVIKQSAFIRGPFVDKFNSNFAASHHFKHAIGVANGTDALYIIMKMLGIREGDEVITTALSWISSSESVSQTGARPVFVDIEPDYYNIDAAQIENKITPRTKAILPVHLYGHPADIKAIRTICERHHLFLIEDCAQAHFATVDDQYVGTFGIASEFSFYPGKNLGAYGDAGAIVTNDPELARKFQMYANHGALKKHFHDFEGVNSRLDGLQAAILDVKLKYIDEWTEKRIQVAAVYSEMLSDVKEVVPPVVRKNAKHVYHVYNIRAKHRDELRDYLNERQIETAIHYPSALPNMPAYQYLGHRPSDFPAATEAVKNILSLPIFPEITRQQIEFVVNTIKEFYLRR